MKAWLDGNIVDESETHVSLLSHSFSRGSAIFEVVDIIPTSHGPALFGLNEHVDRFYNSAKLTYMDIPFDKEQLIKSIIETGKANGVNSGAAKFFAYYPNMEIKILPTNPEISLAIFTLDLNDFGIKREDLSAPITVGISGIRKNHPESVPPHAKIVGNYVNSFMSVMEVQKRGFQEALLLDTMGFVAEGPSSNVFFVKDRKIITPHLRAVLPGITRAVAIQALKDMNYIVDETDIRPADIVDCDEAFFTSSMGGIRPVKALDGRKVGTACPGPVTTVLINKMTDIIEGKLETYRKWLTYIH